MSGKSRNLPLLGGRSTRPLDQHAVNRVSSTFLGLDPDVRSVRYDEGSRTVFRVVAAEASDTGEEFGEIVFGPDIYPGGNIANPNANLSMRAAAAHELAHYHRWLNRTELDGDNLVHLDEAMTSLEAVQRYGHRLDYTDIIQLIGDALHRLGLYMADVGE
jgi:hypothetical protein